MKDRKKVKETVVKAIASEGHAEGGNEGLGGWDRPGPARHGSDELGGRIEPAEPEPPPAHSLGRVDEDVMGRSGQLVRPRSLDAGGVAGGRNWWRGWWLGPRFHRFFFLHFWSPWARKIDQNCSKSQNRRKNRKNNKKVAKNISPSFRSCEPK